MPPLVLAPRMRSGRVRQVMAAFALLSPALVLALAAYLLPLLNFLRYSLVAFRGGRLLNEFSTEAYAKFFGDPYYHRIVWDSLKLSLLVTGCALVLGYPVAYALSRVRNEGLRRWIGVIVFAPLVVSVVVRSYGWTILLSDQGVLNWLLLRAGLIDEPVQFVFNLVGVIIALTHIFLPFAVFPIYSVLTNLDPSLKEAAADLGAGWWTTFRAVTLPLSLPGIAAAGQICFALALGAFVTPSLLGGGRVLVLSLNVYQHTIGINWPLAAVGGIALLVLSTAAVAAFNALIRRWSVEA